MRIAKYQGESDLAKLVGRLYSIKGPGSKALAKEAELALLRANPQLEDPSRITPGAILVVPPVPKAGLTDESRLGGVFSDEALADLLRLATAAKEALQASFVRQAEDERRTLELLKSADLKKFAKLQPAIGETLAAMASATKDRQKIGDALHQAHKQTSAQRRQELDRLTTLLS